MALFPPNIVLYHHLRPNRPYRPLCHVITLFSKTTQNKTKIHVCMNKHSQYKHAFCILPIRYTIPNNTHVGRCWSSKPHASSYSSSSSAQIILVMERFFRCSPIDRCQSLNEKRQRQEREREREKYENNNNNNKQQF